jgi:hypothetical protein
VDEDADDALAKLLTNGVPAAHPRPSEVPAEAPAPSGEPSQGELGGEHSSGDENPGGDTALGPGADPSGHVESAESEARPGANPWERRRDGRPSIMSRLTLAPRHDEDPDDALKLHDGVSTDTREITIAASQLRPVGQQGPTSSPGLDELLGGGSTRRQQRESGAATARTHGDDGDDRPNQDPDQPERQPAKPKRSSIPSWDEIVFGARGD